MKKLLLLLLLLPLLASATVTKVNGPITLANGACSGTPCVRSTGNLAFTPTVGNWLVIAITVNTNSATGTITQVSDSKNTGNYTAIFSSLAVSTVGSTIAYYHRVDVGQSPNITIQASATVSFQAQIYEYSNGGVSPPIGEVSTGKTGNSTSVTCNSITTTNTGAAFAIISTPAFSRTLTHGGSWLNASDNGASGGSQLPMVAWINPSTASTGYSYTGTLNSSANFGCVTFNFQDSGGTPPATTVPRHKTVIIR